jgi:xylan 1,4-beta-xylosidase
MSDKNKGEGTMRSRTAMRTAAALGVLCLAGAAAAQTPAVFDDFLYRGADPAHSEPIGPDQYRNPVLQGFHPDPAVLRVGEDYFLVTSTFAWFPGIPVFHSRDLVSWRQIGSAISRPDQLDFGTLGLSRGVFAPSISHRDGLFYILNTCVDCGGNFVITARDPAGPWSDPTWLPDLEGGIDPFLFFDADGSAWLLNNGPPEGEPLYEGHRAIWIQRFDTETLTTVGPRTVLVNGGVDLSTRPIWIEGPSIIQRNGWYYLICAEGGTAEGHSQVVLRSRRPDGPYEPYPGNPILTQRDLPRDRLLPITSAGHAFLTDTPSGEWWATFLAVRPYEGDFYNTGRETFLMPVDWSGEWPRITDPGQTIPYAARRPDLPRDDRPRPPTSGDFTVADTFDGPDLPPHWLMMRNPRERWWSLNGGALALTPRSVGLGDNGNPSFLGRRQQHMNGDAEVTLLSLPQAEGERFGLAALQNDAFWYTISAVRRGGRVHLEVRRRAGEAEAAAGVLLAETPLEGSGPIRLAVEARGADYAFRWAEGEGAWRDLLTGADGRILSTATAGGFVGTMIGPFAQVER